MAINKHTIVIGLAGAGSSMATELINQMQSNKTFILASDDEKDMMVNTVAKLISDNPERGIEIIRPDELSKLTPFDPEPILIKAQPKIMELEFTPPETRQQRRAKERALAKQGIHKINKL